MLGYDPPLTYTMEWRLPPNGLAGANLPSPVSPRELCFMAYQLGMQSNADNATQLYRLISKLMPTGGILDV